MDLSVFLQPISDRKEWPTGTLGHSTEKHIHDIPEFEGVDVAIIGVKSSLRSVGSKRCIESPDRIRKVLYGLNQFDEKIRVIDLGNIEEGASYEDTTYALKQTCIALFNKKVLPLIIGGSQDLTYACYSAYESLEHTVNLVTIDRTIDIGEMGEGINSANYLSHIILHQPNFLFNFSNIGHQRPYVDKTVLELMNKMYFDVHRLGEISGNIKLAEPILRNADFVSIDLTALRKADLPGNPDAGPNGFEAREMCQLSRYAGMGDKLTGAGFFNAHPGEDGFTGDASLVAEMIWYFLEGMSYRKGDYPSCKISEYTKYIVDLDKHQLVFYKSPKSDRWWMDVPFPAGTKNKYDRHHLVPCDYEDYQTATNEEVPDKWWKTYQKLV